MLRCSCSTHRACRSDGALKLGYELSWLQLLDTSRKHASQEVLRDFGDHIKSAIHCTYIHDFREESADHIAGKQGQAFRIGGQVSGLTPDANPLQFVQGRLDYHFARNLSESTNLTIDAGTGVLCHLYSNT